MNQRLMGLPGKEQRGSRARCILLTDGSHEEVAMRLTAMVAPYGSVDPTRHVWAPGGFANTDEAKLGDAPAFLSGRQRDEITNWWLVARHPHANTPNWDIASQATINGREGLILVEAKAHAAELDQAGKRIDHDASEESTANHKGIAQRISEASDALSSYTGCGWNLSHDSHYQMSNRFAWAWKLTAMGIPVILVYLGFLVADEMQDRGESFKSGDQWRRIVESHSQPLFPNTVWERCWKVNGVELIPLIRCATVSLDGAVG